MSQSKAEQGLIAPYHAIIGAAPNTPVNLVNPETGEVLDSMFSGEWADEFAKRFPEQRETRRKIEDILCQVLDIKTPEAAKVFGSMGFIATVDLPNIRNRILNMIPYLQKYPEQLRDTEMRKFGDNANEFIQTVIDMCFPRYDQKVEQSEEVKNSNDIADLLIKVLDTDLDLRIRYEARRKIALMYMFGEIVNMGEMHRNYENTQNKFMDFLGRALTEGRQGASVPVDIVSWHDPEDGNKATKVKIMSKEESEGLGNRDHTKITPRDMRTTVIKGKDGKNVRIILKTRTKSTESILSKMMRSNVGLSDYISNPVLDTHGISMMCETKEDVMALYKALKPKFKEYITKEIDFRLENVDIAFSDDEEEKEKARKKLNKLKEGMEEGVIDFVVIKDVENTLDGDDEYNAKSPGSSKDFRVLKFCLSTSRPDRRGELCQYVYEIQLFCPDGYVEYEYKDGLAHDEYEINRLVDNIKVDEKDVTGEKIKETYLGVVYTLFPRAVYPGVNHEEARKRAIKAARAKRWSNGNGESLAS